MGLHPSSSLAHLRSPKGKVRVTGYFSQYSDCKYEESWIDIGKGGGVRGVSLLQKSPTAVEPTQPPTRWVAKQLGEESVEINLHPPHTFIARTGSLFHFILRS